MAARGSANATVHKISYRAYIMEEIADNLIGMSITKNQANTNSNAALVADNAAALARFVTDADALIAQATSEGKFRIMTHVFDRELSPTDVINYYVALGYQVGFPDQLQNLAIQPAQLFGINWINFWSGPQAPNPVTYPIRIVIDWA